MTVWNWLVLGLSLALGARSGGLEVVHITHAIPPWLEHEDLSELRWVIRGDTLNGEAWTRSYPCNKGGLEPVEFRDRHGRWTTCHADFSAPDSLQFIWNTCCGGFSVTGPDLRNRWLEVKLVQSEQWQEKQGAMLRCGDTVFHAHETDPVHDWCASAMTSNLRYVETFLAEALSDGEEEFYGCYVVQDSLHYSSGLSEPVSVDRVLLLPTAGVLELVVDGDGRILR